MVVLIYIYELGISIKTVLNIMEVKPKMKNLFAGLAVLMLMSTVYATDTFQIVTNFDVNHGYAIQMTEISDYKMNVVAIGNLDVVAECVPPWELPEDIFEAAVNGLDYAGDIHGSGTMSTAFISGDYGISTFHQEVAGTVVAVAQMTDIADNTQELLLATDGVMSWEETIMVDVNTNNGNIQAVQVMQTASMDAWGEFGQSTLYNNIDAPGIDFGLYQYAAAPDIEWDFGLIYPIP